MSFDTVQRGGVIRRASKRASRSSAPAPGARADAIDRVVLDADERYRRRIALPGEGGTRFCSTCRATALRDGDGLVLDDGTIVAVVAQARAAGRDRGARTPPRWRASPGISATATPRCESSATACASGAITCWKTCCSGLGARLTPIEAPFEPERGAYDHGHRRSPAISMSEARTSTAGRDVTLSPRGESVGMRRRNRASRPWNHREVNARLVAPARDASRLIPTQTRDFGQGGRRS